MVRASPEPQATSPPISSFAPGVTLALHRTRISSLVERISSEPRSGFLPRSIVRVQASRSHFRWLRDPSAHSRRIERGQCRNRDNRERSGPKARTGSTIGFCQAAVFIDDARSLQEINRRRARLRDTREGSIDCVQLRLHLWLQTCRRR